MDTGAPGGKRPGAGTPGHGHWQVTRAHMRIQSSQPLESGRRFQSKSAGVEAICRVGKGAIGSCASVGIRGLIEIMIDARVTRLRNVLPIGCLNALTRGRSGNVDSRLTGCATARSLWHAGILARCTSAVHPGYDFKS